MKVLLLGFGKIAYMPYMNFYLDIFKKDKDILFDLIYWDRDGKKDIEIPNLITNVYKFESHLEEQLPFKKKIKYFKKYRAFSLKILQKKKYDFIFVLHTTPGLTLLDYLLIHYRKKYVLDFRDISYEYILIYRKLVSWLVKNSAITYVSSDSFRNFLPKLNNICTIHNYLEDSLNHKFIMKNRRKKSDVLRVRYWGLVRQLDVNIKIMDALGNDSRFELHYHGRLQKDGRDMESYAKSKNYQNIFFHGQYMPLDRYDFANKTDFIHNIYDLGYTTKNAMGNKFYDGIIFGIPQICTNDSFMGKMVSNGGVGLTVELNDCDIAEKIWNYYFCINWDEFEENCKTELNKIILEQDFAKKQLLNIINYMK